VIKHVTSDTARLLFESKKKKNNKERKCKRKEEKRNISPFTEE
jgi:hypothetical protein